MSTSETSALLAALQERVDAGNAAVAQKDGPGWNREMYAPDVVILGEGLPEPVRGRVAADALIAELLASGAMDDRRIEITTADGAGEFAFTLIRFHHMVDPADEGARALYVWRKSPEGWRVVADMYQTGNLTKP